jgi:hypothetical protein
MVRSSALNSVLEQLAVSLRVAETEPELRECVLRLLSDEFVQLVQITFDKGAARMTESSIILEPSDLLLELLTAVRANDGDAALACEHKIRSLDLIDTV